jgi:hypothetical protein
VGSGRLSRPACFLVSGSILKPNFVASPHLREPTYSARILRLYVGEDDANSLIGLKAEEDGIPGLLTDSLTR